MPNGEKNAKKLVTRYLLTNNAWYCLISIEVPYQGDDVLFTDAIAHDKGKPTARLGRKAVSLAENP
jgi:hypothetical protein